MGELLKSVGIADLLHYQEDAVVSRTVLEKGSGTVTVFAFDQGLGLSEHTTPYDTMVYVIDGEAQITISDSPVTVTEGEMIIMPANEPHALKAEQRFKMILTMIKS